MKMSLAMIDSFILLTSGTLVMRELLELRVYALRGLLGRGVFYLTSLMWSNSNLFCSVSIPSF